MFDSLEDFMYRTQFSTVKHTVFVKESRKHKLVRLVERGPQATSRGVGRCPLTVKKRLLHQAVSHAPLFTHLALAVQTD